MRNLASSIPDTVYHYPTLNNAGDIEVIDLRTGEVISNSSVAPTYSYSFNYNIALLICERVREGHSLNDISIMEGMPPLSVISHWQRMDRMFAEELKLARAARADYHHEKMLNIANRATSDNPYHKDDLPSVKLGVDIYKWSAAKNKPETYGEKITHEGNTEKPILMRVINTGIQRSAPQVIDAEIKESSNGSSTEQSKWTGISGAEGRFEAGRDTEEGED